MKNEVFETLIGAAVIAVAVSFFIYTYNTTDSGAVQGYELTARFSRVDGITPGSDVRMSGIKIGTVSGQELDPQTFLAIVRMTISQDIELPEDSSVRISSESLLGGNYIDVEPGGSMETLVDGGQILHTQGSVNLMDLIGQAIFAVGGSSSEDE